MNTIIGNGGSIIKDDMDKCYYYSNSVYEDLETNEVELAVVVINEYGFWTKSDSILHITTIKEPSSTKPCP